MKEEILKLIKHCKEEINLAIESKKMGILEEGFCNGTNAIYEYIITMLEAILNSEDVKRAKPKESCRCYINSKYYAHQAKIGGAGMKNHKPCPIHEDC